MYACTITLTVVAVLLFFICLKNNRMSGNVQEENIKKLTRQCSRWLIAAQQDESPLIATLHVQYGMGYLWAIKDITTTEEFRKATELDFLTFENQALKIQDEVSKQIVRSCPQFAGDINRYLGKIAGEL